MIKLPIYFNSLHQQQLKELGIEQSSEDSFSDAVIDDVFFFHIIAVSDRTPKDGRTTIYANADTWITPLPINEVIKLIQDAK